MLSLAPFLGAVDDIIDYASKFSLKARDHRRKTVQVYLPNQHQVKIGLAVHVAGGKGAINEGRVNRPEAAERISHVIAHPARLENDAPQFGEDRQMRVEGIHPGIGGRLAQEHTRAFEVLKLFPDRAIVRGDSLTERAGVQARTGVQ